MKSSKRFSLLLPLLLAPLALAPLATQASGGGTAQQPWNPRNTITVLFAFNADMQSRGAACWSKFTRYCKSAAQYAQEQGDYLNYVFETSSINLRAVPKWTGLSQSFYGDEAFKSSTWNVLRPLAEANRANITFVVNADGFGHVVGTCGYKARVCWTTDVMRLFSQTKHVMAHELGHYFGLDHDRHAWRKLRPYSNGWATWAWTDLMHYIATNGSGLIKKDVYSDHSIRCDAFYMCGYYNHGSGARFLRETYGEYRRGW